MAKALISSLLEKQLGKYIDGLSSESLKVGLWDGQVELQNLSLKQDALRELNLPVCVVHGHVRRVKLFVPWNSLGSSSVELLIEGVTLIAQPNAELPSKEQVKASKLSQLARAEFLRHNNKDEEESTYLARLFARIVDNLQVTLTDIHVRYEDRLTDPEHPFAVGLKFNEFRYVTTDSNGNQVFIDRSNDAGFFFYKVTHIQSICLYWNQLEEEQERMDYLMTPMTLMLRLIKNESLDYSIHPKWEIQLSIQNIEFGLSEIQFDQILRLERAFASRLAVEAHFSQFSTPMYPVYVDSVDWWRYLARRAINSTRKFCRMRWKSVQRAGDHRRQYLELWKTYHQHELESIPRVDRHSMLSFEEYYPIQVIIRLRSMAEQVLEKEQQAKSWYNYFFAADDVLTDQGRQDVAKALDIERVFEENNVPDGSCIATVKAHVESGVLRLFAANRQDELISVAYDGQVMLDFQPKGWFVQFTLHRFLVHHANDASKRFQNVLTVAKKDHKSSCLNVRFWSAETKLRITALSFLFVLDAQMLLEIKSFFTTKHSIAAWTYATESLQGWVSENETELYALLETRKKWDISIDMEAPVCLIPDQDSSVLILDLGHFVLTNHHAPDGQDSLCDHWNVEMNRLQIQLCSANGIDPDTNQCTNPSLITKLVHEFSIAFSVQTLVTSSADAPLSVPSISASANLPSLRVTLSEPHVLVLGRIQALLLSQIDLNDTTSAEAPAAVAEPLRVSSSQKQEEHDQRCLVQFEFNVATVEVQLCSLPNGPIDILETVLTGAELNLLAYPAHTSLHAQVSSLQVKDKFHDDSSPYSLLAYSTSDDSSKDSQQHLIDIKMEFQAETNRIECTFNTLTIQWNPSTISMLYRLIESYLMTCFTSVEQLSEMGQQLYPPSAAKRCEISASLNQLCVTFNKDEQNRSLVTFSMLNTIVQFHLENDTTYEITGQVGNLTAQDNTMKDDSLYRQLLGLQESSKESGSESLVQFNYQVSADESSLDLTLSPIQIVYIHQQVIELADYLFEGVLGILQTTLEYAVVATRLYVVISKPVILIPVHRSVSEHVSITASSLTLTHEPRAQVDLDAAEPVSVVDRKTVHVNNVSATIITSSPSAACSLLDSPLKLQVLILDRLTDPPSPFPPSVPRFDIQFIMPQMKVHLVRSSYIVLCNVLTNNFGQGQPETTVAVCDTGLGNERSYRPRVDYSYADPSVELLTMCLSFQMDRFECQVPELAKFEMNQLNVSLWTLKDENPHLVVQIDSMVVRETMAQLGIHPHHAQIAKLGCPLTLKYEWLTDTTTTLVLKFQSLYGIMIPQVLHALVSFFHLKSNDIAQLRPAAAAPSSSQEPKNEEEFYMKTQIEASAIQLIALDDFTSAASQIVTIRADFDITSEMDRNEIKTQLEAYGIEMAIVGATTVRSNCPASEPIQLIEPTKVRATYIETDIQDVINVEIDPIQVFMSYQDLLLLQRVIHPVTQFQALDDGDGAAAAGDDDRRQPAAPRRKYLECQIKTVQFVFINDHSGCDLPVLQLQMNKCNVFVNGTRDEFSGGGYFHFCAFYSTPANCQWHTLCDPWTLEATIQGQPVRPKRQLLLTASNPLSMYITNDMLQVMASVAGTFSSSSAEHSSDSCGDKMYTLINETGYPISYQLNAQKLEMKPLDRHCIEFLHTKGSGSGIKRYDADAERILTVYVAEEYQPVRLLRFDELGTFAFPLLYSNGSLSKASLIADTRLSNGKIILTLSSKVRVVNATTLTLDLLASDPIWPNSAEIGRVQPNDSICIPLSCIQASELRCKPATSSSWSSPIPLKHVASSDQEGSGSSSFKVSIGPATIFRVLVQSRSNVMTEFSLYQPIRVINKTPVQLEYQIRNKERGARGRVESGQSASLSMAEATSKSAALFGMFRIEGCSVSKWIELKPDRVFKTIVKRQNRTDVNLLIQLDPLTSAKCLVVTCLVECWLINLTRLHLIYGNGDALDEAWSSSGDKITPASSGRIRVCLEQNNWSGVFDPDPKRLTWHAECLQLFKHQSLYEFGVSADYSTRAFGTLTTLVTFFPRYVIQSTLEQPVLIREMNSPMQAIHQLIPDEEYMMYWISGSRSRVLVGLSTTDPPDWSSSDGFRLDKEATHEMWLVNQWVQINVKRGEACHASFVITICSIAQPLLDNGNSTEDETDGQKPDWSVTADFSGLQLSIASKEQFIETNPLFGTIEQSKDAFVAELNVSSVRLDLAVLTGDFCKFHLTIDRAVLYDHMLNTKHRMVLCPATDSSSSFIQVFYHERLTTTRYRHIQHVSVSIQPIRLQTTMTFVIELNRLIMDIGQTYSPERRSNHVDDALLTTTVVSSSGSVAGAPAPATGRVYFHAFHIDPIRVNIYSFRREKGQLLLPSDQLSFWVRNLKVEISDAWLVLDRFALNKVFGTTHLIQTSMSSFYLHSIQSQALSLLDSVQVTSLVTNLVTDGVSNLVSTLTGIGGGGDTTGSSNRPGTTLSGEYSFRPEMDLSNAEILRKHAIQLRSSDTRQAFFKNFYHLVYDWDMNHQGLEARKCIAVAVLNSSKESIRFRTVLQTGAELAVLGDHLLSSVSTLDHDYWDPKRSAVVFAYGSFMPAWNVMMNASHVKVTIESNAFRAVCSEKEGKVRAHTGFTASFVEQVNEKWYARYVLIVSDDVNAAQQMTTHTIECRTNVLGIVAHQESDHRVKVKEYTGPLQSSDIQVGDQVVAVNDIPVQSIAQFKHLVTSSPRPISLRLKRSCTGR